MEPEVNENSDDQNTPDNDVKRIPNAVMHGGIEYEQSVDLRARIAHKFSNKKITWEQEYFAFLVASGSPKNESYKIAYHRMEDKNTTLISNGSKTSKNEIVYFAIDYFKDLRSRKSKDAFNYGIADAFEEIDIGMQWCRDTKDKTNWLKAIKLKSDLAGLIIDRKEIKTENRSLDVINMELKELIKQIPMRELMIEDISDVDPK